MEVILEGFMNGIESISVLHREAIKLPWCLDACRIKRCDNLYSGEETLMRHHWSYARF